ncbi:chromosome-anchoring protein RacA [Caldalkalibacillus uzonensis]|uniref:Chromosome-anchoring protein RacA n=1 Tax=Caldalkalibacillus uzonensis TaxID=353224 RepID=A0ABU0CNS2_9BACI|nr:MerR family transcriptional regulator [Caldalkalibacillus uzonensis]MDQ0338060.1 chromosome-anchoring protein RacA [Caldalkalibacillus uzonensis]
MGKALKTKEVAKRLGVSSRTIQRWVRNFNLPYQTNARGHYTFEEQHIKLLQQIRDQLHAGVPLEKVAPTEKSNEGGAGSNLSVTDPTSPKQDTEPNQTAATSLYDSSVKQALTKVEAQLENLEKSISTKADEVVYEQMIIHRRELDRLTATVSQLEYKLDELEHKITELKALLQVKEEHQPKKRFSFFSFARQA